MQLKVPGDSSDLSVLTKMSLMFLLRMSTALQRIAHDQNIIHGCSTSQSAGENGMIDNPMTTVFILQGKRPRFTVEVSFRSRIVHPEMTKAGYSLCCYNFDTSLEICNHLNKAYHCRICFNNFSKVYHVCFENVW